MKGIEEGTTLAGRYHLTHKLSQSDHDELWLAQDDSLGREVTIAAFSATSSYGDAALDSARRAAGVEDPRLLRVLDVGREGEDTPSGEAGPDSIAYVVSESVNGAESIASMLQFDPLHPEEARRLVGEAASGLATAASRGLHHQALTPHSILRTRSGSVLVLGLPIAAALAGKEDLSGAVASRDDATALVRILYAAVTGKWPGPVAVPGLDSVVRGKDDRVPSASSFAGDIPGDIDSLIDDALNDNAGPATPRDLARQLAPWSSERVTSDDEAERSAIFSDLDDARPSSGPSARTSVAATGVGLAAAGAAASDHSAGHGVGPSDGSADAAGRGSRGTAPTTAAGAGFGSSHKDDADADIDDPDTTQIRSRADFDQDETTTFTPGTAPKRPSYDDEELEPPAPLGFDSGMEADRQSSKLTLAIVAACVLVALALAVVGVTRIGAASGGSATSSTSASSSAPSGSASSSSGSSSSSASSSVAAGKQIQITAANAYEPGGSGDHDELAKYAIDGKTSTAWSTMRYGSAQFGGLKDGTGLVLDLGSSQQVSTVKITIRGMPSTMSVFVGDQPTKDGTPFGTIDNGSGEQTVTGSSPAKGRYVTIWITQLSAIGGNLYRDRISEVEVLS